MCGRARLPNDYSEIKIQLKFSDEAMAPNLRPSWNIAPTQDMLVAIRDPESGARIPAVMRWGLIPSWSKEPKMQYPTFNAKAETVDKLASFRGAWKAGRRCLVVTDGFYEWRKGDKQPFAIACVNDRLTIMAGTLRDLALARGRDGEVVYRHHDGRECVDRAAARPDAGNLGRRGLACVAWRGAGD